MGIAIPGALDGLRPLLAGYALTPEGALESRVDDGPPKARRQSTLVMETAPVVFRMTPTVYADTFRPFYETTLARGAFWFDWVEPLTGDTVAAQFVGGNPPTPIKTAGGRIRLSAVIRIKR